MRPFVPVIVTLYRPAGTLDAAVSVKVVVLVPPADSLTVKGLNDAVGSVGPAPTLEGMIDEDMLTGPVKPVLFRPIVIVTRSSMQGLGWWHSVSEQSRPLQKSSG